MRGVAMGGQGMALISMRQTALAIANKDIALQGLLSVPENSPPPIPALVVCHPHPMLGGNMENPVVSAICSAAGRQGIASLRFNFRGVGGSGGTFTNGAEERSDLKVAFDLVRRWPGIDGKRVALVGYSFGATVLLGGLRQYRAARSLVAIAPPVASVRRSTVARDGRPKLFIAGQSDRIAPPVELQRVLDEMRPPVRFVEIPGADHSLRAAEGRVAEHVIAFAIETLLG